MSIQDLWQDVQPQIEQRIGAQNHEIWVKPIRVLGMDGDLLELEVPNRYYSDWVRDNYEQIFVEELARAFGIPLRLRFTVEADARRAAPAPSPSAAGEPPPPAAPPPDSPPIRNPVRSRVPRNKTFDNYVVGACNKFAHAAALAVADFPGQNYNPLFVFGGTGLGKTHLVQAIGNRIQDARSDAGVIYTTAEDFVNDMIRALRFKKMDSFRQRYRDSADVLLIDDIQFLSGKVRSQEEFFHTFEALKLSGKQVVLTSDVLPREIEGLEPRLRTRFEGGLLADVQAPDLETMVAILQAKAETLRLPIGEECALWIASHVNGNIRELEGAINRLAALGSFYGDAITVEFAREHLGSMLVRQQEAITPERVMQVVARYFNIRVGELKGQRKLKGIVLPRQIAMFIAREHTDLSFPDLGRAFGGRDHSTVQHACKKIKRLEKTDPDLQSHLRTLERNLGVSR
ncbi:MAG: chromosomal replication initiator protein DnaA [Myxococcota bacterium]|nr:chromosomal replication initiator protein DnaA [Myxococcota bacterium]